MSSPADAEEVSDQVAGEKLPAAAGENFHDRTVISCGRVCLGRRKIDLSHAFAGQTVGIKEVAEKIWHS